MQKSPLERALPQILERALGRGMRALVRTPSSERAEALATSLWAHPAESFLPHGTAKDGQPALQPIWLTPDPAENPNGATLLVLVDGAEPAGLESYAMVCDLFDGADPQAEAAARLRWSAAKAAGHALSYWRQDERGGWEQKA